MQVQRQANKLLQSSGDLLHGVEVRLECPVLRLEFSAISALRDPDSSHMKTKARFPFQKKLMIVSSRIRPRLQPDKPIKVKLPRYERENTIGESEEEDGMELMHCLRIDRRTKAVPLALFEEAWHDGIDESVHITNSKGAPVGKEGNDI